MPAHTVRNWRPWRKICSHPMLVINYVTKLACLTLKVEHFHHFKVPTNTSQRSGSVTVCPLKACKGRGQSGWWIKKGGLQLHNRSARPSQQLRAAQSVCDWTPKPPLSFSSVCPTILISQPPLQCWVRDEGGGGEGLLGWYGLCAFHKVCGQSVEPRPTGLQSGDIKQRLVPSNNNNM